MRLDFSRSEIQSEYYAIMVIVSMAWMWCLFARWVYGACSTFQHVLIRHHPLGVGQVQARPKNIHQMPAEHRTLSQRPIRPFNSTKSEKRPNFLAGVEFAGFSY